jgi:thiamine kinase-like enzyme
MPLNGDQHAEEKIKEYFKIAFHDSSEWKDAKLKDLVEYEHFMAFILKYMPQEHLFWENYFYSAKMPQSSAHGDFHVGNILSKGGKLLFIDWTNFRSRSSRYFDLFNYDIFSQREENTSWVERWHKEYIEHKKSSIREIEISRSHVIGFAIWRVSAEIEILTARKKLTPQKIRKYKDLIISLLLLSRTC